MARSENQASFPAYRPRRLRTQPTIRDMVRENTLTPMDLIWPVFVMDGQDAAQPISSMPGISRHTIACHCHSLPWRRLWHSTHPSALVPDDTS